MFAGRYMMGSNHINDASEQEVCIKRSRLATVLVDKIVSGSRYCCRAGIALRLGILEPGQSPQSCLASRLRCGSLFARQGHTH
jgi:hypothetical protein